MNARTRNAAAWILLGGLAAPACGAAWILLGGLAAPACGAECNCPSGCQPQPIAALVLKIPVSVEVLAPVQAWAWSAAWCAPCRQLDPILDRLRGEGFTIWHKDFDADRAEAAKCGIATVPMIQIGRGGAELDRRGGAESIEVLRAWLTTRKVQRREREISQTKSIRK